jgi:hypothetical protein
MSLATFKNFSADRMDVDELIALSAFGKAFKAEFVSLGVDVPEYVDLQLKTLKREVRGRVADKLEADKRRIKAQLDSLKTTSERKAELKKQLDTVEAQLAVD